MKNKSKLKQFMPFVAGVIILTSLGGCGSDDDDSGSSRAPQPEQQTDEGVYRAVLNPENPSVTTAVGTTEIRVQGDNLTARVLMGNAPSTTHIQHVHVGTRCPTPADDTNNDGVVDATEASAVYGAPFIFLDDDLVSDSGTFPSGASYNYDEDASVAQLLSSLNVQTLGLEGKVVNIHGVPESEDLPATAQGGKANFPIACGVLQRVSDGGTTTGTTTGGTTTGGTTTGGTTTGGTTTGGTTTGGTTTGGTTTGGTTTGGTTTGGTTTGGTTTGGTTTGGTTTGGTTTGTTTGGIGTTTGATY